MEEEREKAKEVSGKGRETIKEKELMKVKVIFIKISRKVDKRGLPKVLVKTTMRS